MSDEHPTSDIEVEVADELEHLLEEENGTQTLGNPCDNNPSITKIFELLQQTLEKFSSPAGETPSEANNITDDVTTEGDDILQQISAEYEKIEERGPPVNEKLAKILQDLIWGHL